MHRFPAALLAALCAALPTPALAQSADEPAPKPLDLGAAYVADIMVAAPGGAKARAYYLDNLDLTADADLDALIGWRGATIHIDVLDNLGGMPNVRAGTLQGVDNIEVASHRLRLFEAWIEQKLGSATSVRAGLYDLNSEFYSNDAAGLLIAPAFGVGSEIAATGPNGPSIFPSTALAVRIDHRFAETLYARAAVLNGIAGTLGDPGGVNLSFNDGALLIAEAGYDAGGTKFGIGAWGYTVHQDDIRAVDAAGTPVPALARGLYLIAERPLNDPEAVRAAAAFLRIGISDGRTTPFAGGWQAGVLVRRLWAARPESQLSLGMNQGYLSAGYRDNLRDGGARPARAETAFELTYSDKLAGWLTVQPDVQFILDPGGDRNAKSGLFGGMRVTLEL